MPKLQKKRIKEIEQIEAHLSNAKACLQDILDDLSEKETELFGSDLDDLYNDIEQAEQSASSLYSEDA